MRILLLWNDTNIQVTPILITTQLIHCLVKHVSSAKLIHCAFIYGNNDGQGRKQLWADLISVSPNVGSWLVMGDFNAVRSEEERISRSPPSSEDINDFNTCLSSCNLDDLQRSGCEFSWINNQAPPNRTWCRLDRALIND